MTAIQLTMKSRNAKVGEMPVSTTSDNTCPSSCPLFAGGCYAKAGPLGMMWRALSQATPGEKYALPRGAKGQSLTWDEFCESIEGLEAGTLWRHNQAGDLPGERDAIDVVSLAQLVAANEGKRGFTYTHKPLEGEHGESNANAIKDANERGFTVNLSADNMREADQLAATGIAPVVVVLPAEVHGNVKLHTPEGRRVSVCPATYIDDVSCKSCGLCQRRDRKTIVGFPAHGASRRKASAVASS